MKIERIVVCYKGVDKGDGERDGDGDGGGYNERGGIWGTGLVGGGEKGRTDIEHPSSGYIIRGEGVSRPQDSHMPTRQSQQSILPVK